MSRNRRTLANSLKSFGFATARPPESTSQPTPNNRRFSAESDGDDGDGGGSAEEEADPAAAVRSRDDFYAWFADIERRVEAEKVARHGRERNNSFSG
jgi:hypothetical protein